MAYIRQSRPDHGLNVQVENLNTFRIVPSSLQRIQNLEAVRGKMGQDGWLLHLIRQRVVPPFFCHAGNAEEQRPEQGIFIDKLLVRVHRIIEMIVVERPCAMGV